MNGIRNVLYTLYSEYLNTDRCIYVCVTKKGFSYVNRPQNLSYDFYLPVLCNMGEIMQVRTYHSFSN